MNCNPLVARESVAGQLGLQLFRKCNVGKKPNEAKRTYHDERRRPCAPRKDGPVLW